MAHPLKLKANHVANALIQSLLDALGSWARSLSLPSQMIKHNKSLRNEERELRKVTPWKWITLGHTAQIVCCHMLS